MISSLKNHYNVVIELLKEKPNKIENYTNYISTKMQSIVSLADYESALDMIQIMTKGIDLKDFDEINIRIVRF